MSSPLEVVQTIDSPLFFQNPAITIMDVSEFGDKITIGVLTDADADSIPDKIAGFDVEKIVFPKLKALGCAACTDNAHLTCDPTRVQKIRPISGGISVGHYRVTAGTIGCIVKDAATGSPMILSNNHVIANQNNASAGDPIYQPGVIDGGNSGSLVAYLTRWIPIDFNNTNTVDCAVALINSDYVNAWYGENGEQVPEKGFYTGSVVGDTCQKYGRTTGFTMNTIISTTASFPVRYESGDASFQNQMVFSSLSGSDNPCCPGDSGSGLLDTQGRLIGLVFAGGNTDQNVEIGVANPIGDIVSKLNITIPGGSQNQICTPGSVKCQSDHTFTCSQDGMSWVDGGVSASCQTPTTDLWAKLAVALPFGLVLGIVMSPKPKYTRKK